MNFKGIGISHLPNQRYRNLCRKKQTYNIMVIGSSGSGKTTFINQLFNKDIIPKDIEPDSIITYKDNYNLQQTVLTPENYNYNDALLNFQITKVELTDRKVILDMSITEIDNIGEKIDNTDCWVPIINYIHDLYKDYYIQSKDTVRQNIYDRRIHACIYFIDGCGSPAKEVDMRIIKDVSAICNLIPVVSKCDILLNNEMDYFYGRILEELDKQNIEIYVQKDDVIEPPYFIMSDRVGRLGKVENYGDFAILKDVLIKSGMIDLIEKTESFYEAYRAKYILMKDENIKNDNEEDLKLKEDFLLRLQNEEEIGNIQLKNVDDEEE